MNLAIDDQHPAYPFEPKIWAPPTGSAGPRPCSKPGTGAFWLRGSKEETMPRIKHIALTTKEPARVAAFYRDAFGMQEIRRAPNGAVFLTDGYINLAILNWKTEKSADVGANGPNYSGIHHFGFEVEDLDEAAAKLEHAEGQRLEEKEGLDMEMAAGGHRNFEMKWAGPDGVVIDISHTGWETKTR
jgi:catechol 2,3-dioxygenase-like lactoylglutathione lyase family enzyme